ncbi:MAG: peroxiredoxin family protein [Massilia sp.]
MATENQPRAHWIKPVIIGVVMAALAVGGYLTFNSRSTVPDVTFISLSGQKVSTASLRGKVVLINFWATSCVTCVKEMPRMVDTYQQFKDQGLEFVAVAMKYDPPNYVLNYTESHHLPFIVALDAGGDIAQAFDGVASTPTTYLIDKDGKVLKRYVGEPDFNALHALLKQKLAG